MTHQAVSRCTSALARLNSPVRALTERRYRRNRSVRFIVTLYDLEVPPEIATGAKHPRNDKAFGVCHYIDSLFLAQVQRRARLSPSPTRRVRLPGSWYKSAVTPRDATAPVGSLRDQQGHKTAAEELSPAAAVIPEKSDAGNTGGSCSLGDGSGDSLADTRVKRLRMI